ncbi:MAG: IPT/TIG domain-containing protein, partial [Myxococcales bacterium]
IVNRSGLPVALEGLTIADAAAVKFTFPAATLPPGEAAVVFGGGSVAAFRGEFGNARALGLVFSASATGGLGLNNTGADSAAVQKSGSDLDRLSFSGTTDGTSYVRSPESDPAGVVRLHDTVTGASGKFSPGTRANGEPFTRYVSAVEPRGGRAEGGEEVRVRGAGFGTQVTSVVFRRGGQSALATNVRRSSSLELVVTTPALSAGVADVELVDQFGTLTGVGRYTFGLILPDAGIAPDAGELPDEDAGEDWEYPDEDPLEEPEPLPSAGRDGGVAGPPPELPVGVCGCGAASSPPLLPALLLLLALRFRQHCDFL